MTVEEFRSNLEKLGNNMPRVIATGALRGTGLIRQEIVEKHLSGPKMPRGIGDQENATLQPQTGYLRNSIRNDVQITNNSVIGILFSDAEYAIKHEKGRGVPLRPFMRPSIARRMDDYKTIIWKTIEEAIKNGGA